MGEKNISQEFRSKNIEEIKNYFSEEINENELMNKNDKKVCTTLNYIKHFLILASAISVFAFLVGIPIGLQVLRKD